MLFRSELIESEVIRCTLCKIKLEVKCLTFCRGSVISLPRIVKR